MSTKKTDPTLQKCNELIERLQELKKALNPNIAPIRRPVNALGAGWSQDPNTGAFHHGEHGVISTFRNPQGGFTIKHGGGVVGNVPDMARAGALIRQYIGGLKPGATGMRNITSTGMPKQTQWNEMGSSVSDLGKSNYGPPGASEYNQAANAKRKNKNLGAQVGQGPNVNVKPYSTHSGQLSGKQQAAAEAKNVKRLSGPVKHYTPEQIAALEEARKLKKNAENAPWMNHGSVPNADHEVQLIQQNNPAIPGEDAMATQLANMMTSRAMMRPDHRQPSSEEMLMAGQAMGLAPTEEMIKAEEAKWSGGINNWLAEASKPISSRFSSEEEEMAYWNSIKVNGGGGGDYGF